MPDQPTKLRPGPRRGPATEAEQALADELKKVLIEYRIRDYQKKSGDFDLNMLPIPPSPPGFRVATAAPVNLTGSGVVDQWESIRRIAPEMEGVSPRIRYGPTAGMVDLSLSRSGQIPTMDETNTLGVTDNNTREIGLSPKIWAAPKTGYEVLAHELGHAMGRREGDPALSRLESRAKAAAPEQSMVLALLEKFGFRPRGFYR